MTTRTRRLVYGTLVFALGISIAANIAYKYTDGTPTIGAVLFAAAFPLLCLLAIEVMVQVQWQPGPVSIAARWCGFGPVAIVAGVVSYRHMRGLLLSYGEDPVSAAIAPIAVDGLTAMCTVALMAARRPTQDRPRPVDIDQATLDAPRPTVARGTPPAVSPVTVPPVADTTPDKPQDTSPDTSDTTSQDTPQPPVDDPTPHTPAPTEPAPTGRAVDTTRKPTPAEVKAERLAYARAHLAGRDITGLEPTAVARILTRLYSEDGRAVGDKTIKRDARALLGLD